MRHQNKRGSMGRKMSHRKATVKHLVHALLKFQRIKTTERKAKEARPVAEKLITLGKRGDMHARREAYSILADRNVTLKLFNDIVPLFKERTSGFTRIMPFGFRKGDGASMVILELTERKIVEKSPRKAKAARKEAPADAHEHKKASGAALEEAPKHRDEAEQKEPPKPKAASKGKSFLQNLRGRFRRRGTD